MSPLPNPSPLEPSGRGLVLVFTGDGKGKTSAALGAVLRALGHGLRVYVAFFMKGEYPYGERRILSELAGVTFASFGHEGFINPARVRPEEIEQAHKALAAARKATLSGEYELVVLDEVNLAVAWGLVPLADVVGLIDARPSRVGLILTGRQADPKLIELADLATEMVKVKHPYDKGIMAQAGVDY